MKKIDLSHESIREALHESPLGAHLQADEIDSILDFASTYEFSTGESVIEEHEIDQNLYLVVDGNVSVEVGSGEKHVYITTLGQGEIFGEAGLFSNTERTASIIAQDRVTLVQITRQGFLKSINKKPKAAVKFMFMIIFGMLSKLRGVNEELAYERKDDVNQEDIDSILSEITPDD
ncbi:cyclic nucleotide-binding domain-containing protein [Salinispira pacifica]|nr:cyclic nucleotide-binding domain-containing protein [Salinispira pacifica]